MIGLVLNCIKLSFSVSSGGGRRRSAVAEWICFGMVARNSNGESDGGLD